MFRPSEFRIWYVHQVPSMAYQRDVPDPQTGELILDAIYDLAIFQYEQKMIPDYANMGGVLYRDEDGEWIDYHSEEWEELDTGLGKCDWCDDNAIVQLNGHACCLGHFNEKCGEIGNVIGGLQVMTAAT